MKITYNEFIENILNTRGRFIEDKTVYKERHHILMKSLGGNNDEDNLIDLINDEHYIVHKLLALENPNCKEAQNAWWMMSHMSNANNREYEVSQNEWMQSRENRRLAISGENSSWYGRHHTDETKEKISRANKGRKVSQEQKDEVSKRFKGKKQSEELIKKRAFALKGRVMSEEAKQKMKENHADFSKEKHPKYGTHCSNETKDKISKANGREVVCEDVVYQSVVKCAEYYNINYNTMKNWLYGKNKMPQEWVDKGLHFYQ